MEPPPPSPVPPAASAGRWRLNSPRAAAIWRWPTATRRGCRRVAAEIAKAHPRNVTVHRVDVGEPGQIDAIRAGRDRRPPGLNIVVNNAGVALMGTFNEIDQAQMDWLMNINFWGVVHATRAFLPHLSRRREAHIVNLSSIFGIVAPPGQTAYAAAKFAVRGFSESLRHELQMAASPVRLSVVHPGGVATNIARNSRTGAGMTDNARRAQSIERFEAVAKTTPRTAALRIIAGIENNQPRILIGNDARFMDLLQRLRPGNLLGGAGAPDREDDESGKVSCRDCAPTGHANARPPTGSAKPSISPSFPA